MRQIKGSEPQVLNPQLGCLANFSAPQNAVLLNNQMLHHRTSDNHNTFICAHKACCLLHPLHKGQEIQAHVMKFGHLSDTFIERLFAPFLCNSKLHCFCYPCF
ncbi:hypothetical protein RchiOBHm_Chr4g0406541 [Rosa chinensis]|uniref:Uncharacterized protein n=1 Tax=Rosa chinensis TaxID=74649 RepID=A0A2P6QUD1_ROSCH|nr:hypothetical protein RchiOBHm_Chr4g0406541 [Rosa chinensis]